jgi:transposase
MASAQNLTFESDSDSGEIGEMRVCRMRTGINVEVSATDRSQLDAIVADRNAPQKHVWRARIVLLTADGCGTAAIMRNAGVSKTAVWRWQERFMTDGVAGMLRDKTRPSRIPPLEAEIAPRLVSATQAGPPAETTHWTAAAIAEVVQGISVSSVQRIWRRHGLQPHRVRQFKLSNDRQFASKRVSSTPSRPVSRRAS